MFTSSVFYTLNTPLLPNRFDEYSDEILVISIQKERYKLNKF